MADSATRKAGIWTKIAYGSGAAANGIRNNGFEYFLLFYYSQVLGVDSALVGATLMIALFVDGISDPIVGYWSDNLRSRWGRRHPFMYASALPVVTWENAPRLTKVEPCGQLSDNDDIQAFNNMALQC